MTHPGHPRISFRSWLLLLAALATVPMILFSVLTLLVVINSQREVETVALTRRARAVASTLERHLAARASMLAAIASSDAARHDNREALYAHASRIIRNEPAGYSMALLDSDGAILFNTQRPFGQALPDTRDPASAKRVIDTGQAVVSGPFFGSISGLRVVALGVPVFVGETPRYCLRLITPVSELYALLDQQRLPDDWTAAIVADRTLVASYDPSALVGLLLRGKNGVAGLPNGGGDNAGVVREADLPPMEVTRAKVGEWGWSVLVAVPEDHFVKPLRQMLLRFGVGGVLCLVAGLVASLWLARRLDRDVSVLISAGALLAAGNRPYDAGVIIREMGEVRACLLAAKDREEQALTDPLTGLPARARFQELAQALEQAAQCDPRLGLAVLFVDLDGFKQVNDAYGHERGDRMLGETARVLRENIRDEDVAGRLGGDEFVVCLTSPAGQLRAAAVSMAGRIIAGVRAIGYGLGCSVGIAVCEGCSPDLKRALDLADAAMYEAKRLGKDRYVLRVDTTTDGASPPDQPRA